MLPDLPLHIVRLDIPIEQVNLVIELVEIDFLQPLLELLVVGFVVEQTGVGRGARHGELHGGDDLIGLKVLCVPARLELGLGLGWVELLHDKIY